MHICSFVSCLVTVLWTLIHLTGFALNEGNWQVGRKKPNVAKSPIKETARGQTGPETGIRKDDLMTLPCKRHLEETLNEGQEERWIAGQLRSRYFWISKRRSPLTGLSNTLGPEKPCCGHSPSERNRRKKCFFGPTLGTPGG